MNRESIVISNIFINVVFRKLLIPEPIIKPQNFKQDVWKFTTDFLHFSNNMGTSIFR